MTGTVEDGNFNHSLAGEFGDFTGQPHTPVRVVAPPPGRSRAARVAESGSIGDRRPGKPSTFLKVLPLEDLQRQSDKNLTNVRPVEAFHDILSSCRDEVGLTDEVDLPEAILGNGGFIWIALAGDVPVGSVALRKHAITEEMVELSGCTGEAFWEVDLLATLPQHRRKGVARLLMEALMRQFPEASGENDLLYFEAARELLPSLTFFERFGFEEVPFESPLVLDSKRRRDMRLIFRGRCGPGVAATTISGTDMPVPSTDTTVSGTE